MILVALIAGTVGCGGAQAQYALSISHSSGGNVTLPGTGTFTYPAGAIVLLEAVPADGYVFVNWSGNVSTVDDVTAANTTITMNGNYFVTANFVQGQPIRTWYDLSAINNNLSGSYVLMNALDSSTPGYTELASPAANNGTGWEPIGVFAGTFYGQGHEIRDLFINRSGNESRNNVGLFDCVNGTIKDTSVVNANVTGWSGVGALAGGNLGTVSDCYSTGTVTGTQLVGGLVGRNDGTMSSCYVACNLTSMYTVGGLTAFNLGTVINSHYNYDDVLINGEKLISLGALFNADFEEWLANGKFLDVNEKLSEGGGYYLINNINDFKQLLAFGQNASLKFRLTNNLDLAGQPNLYVPYLAGEFDGDGHIISNVTILTLNFSHVCGVGLFGWLAPGGGVHDLGVENVNTTGGYGVGGLVGMSFGTVTNSYAIGSLVGDYYVGGLVGRNEGTASNSYSAGNVTGTAEFGQWVGGLVGGNFGAVSNSYSAGNVTGNSYLGGLVGDGDPSSVNNSFWDTQTSGQPTSDGGTSENTTQM